jgi:nucleoside-diphosphate-sugar epimerase
VLNIIALEVNDMDKVIIYGTYDFLGFSLCEKLLDVGIQVCGIPLNEENSEVFLEDKKLLIGRNANFQEKTLEIEDIPFQDESLKLKTITVISFYDIYYTKEDPFRTYEKIVTNICKQHSQHSLGQLICLFPIGFMHDFPKPLITQINLLNEQKIQPKNIYIPTVFGPWQPSAFLFQQYLLKDYLKSEPKLDNREFTSDAIYIKDIIDTIVQLMDSEEKVDYLIQSSIQDQWIKGANHLKVKEMDTKKQELVNIAASESIKIIKINESISITEGLELQKKHLSRLY